MLQFVPRGIFWCGGVEGERARDKSDSLHFVDEDATNTVRFAVKMCGAI